MTFDAVPSKTTTPPTQCKVSTSDEEEQVENLHYWASQSLNFHSFQKANCGLPQHANGSPSQFARHQQHPSTERLDVSHDDAPLGRRCLNISTTDQDADDEISSFLTLHEHRSTPPERDLTSPPTLQSHSPKLPWFPLDLRSEYEYPALEPRYRRPNLRPVRTSSVPDPFQARNDGSKNFSSIARLLAPI
ncbi:predicted protein [Phaeodactylum tricornutum CCAP 1055/1]|jgi:hypothetical protein|uniref:Uncharacterized protein n=2 Tax=Phaeodactylum tricornutum TaxID=2850 RepID=B7G7F6_PHATC|nr:predicted protein [Phaeodactylum tricornutum CCAP 1055/1]EEC45356.1 predicted protein [Phaeodactylum tricornutum CCAP 1055/1]|eukprot:XP_002183138.1 predicted protein [Phaeodactylum tricornutum CCAP 1055/1]